MPIKNELKDLMKRAEPFNYSPIGDWLAGMNFIWMGANGIVFTSPTSPEGIGHDENSVFSRCQWREVCRERKRLSQLNHENLLLDDPEVKAVSSVYMPDNNLPDNSRLDIITDTYDGSQTYATPSKKTISKYHREIKKGVFVDVYDVIEAFNVTCPALQHLLKKALAAGGRGHKDTITDLRDILASANRAIELESQRGES